MCSCILVENSIENQFLNLLPFGLTMDIVWSGNSLMDTLSPVF